LHHICLGSVDQQPGFNSGTLVTISAAPPIVPAAFRAGFVALWAFLADEDRVLINRIGILDNTEGEYAFRAQPYTFVLRPDLTFHAIYNGWYFIERLTLDEVRCDLRAIMETLSYDRFEFNFTAIPGAGYRTIRAGTAVMVEVVESATAVPARNIQPITST
jgi:hypothetical protein